jgi:glycosyltransferase involved in cell wall biosynthesis
MLDGDTTYTDSLHALATPSVTFLPNRPDVVTPLHAADVAVVPSVWDEPFGRTVIEGMATGIPVLGSRVGGIPEILGPIDRLLFDRGDADQLAAKLAVTLRWRDEEPGLGRACAARVATEFSLAATVDRLEAVFDDVSTARRRA